MHVCMYVCWKVYMLRQSLTKSLSSPGGLKFAFLLPLPLRATTPGFPLFFWACFFQFSLQCPAVQQSVKERMNGSGHSALDFALCDQELWQRETPANVLLPSIKSSSAVFLGLGQSPAPRELLKVEQKEVHKDMSSSPSQTLLGFWLFYGLELGLIFGLERTVPLQRIMI